MDVAYEELREKLETIGMGYPSSGAGLEYPILEALFTPEEAKLFCAIPNGYHSAAEIAEILERPEDEVHDELDKMSLRGNLFRLRTDDGDLYHTIPVVHGIYEFSIPRADPSWIAPMIGHVMQGGWGERVYGTDVPLLRAIPAAGTIEEGSEPMLLDDVDALIKSKKRIALAPCLCRIAMPMVGAPECTHEKETCMAFDEFADFYIENGIAREVTTEEALDVIHRGEKEGLVSQVGTSQRGEVLCNCCSCCCAVLTCLRTFGGPAAQVASNYYAVNNPDLCVQCGTCEERCPMQAITIEDEGVSIDRSKCIGCGVCALGCTQNAMACRRKPDDEFYNPPAKTIFDSYSLQQVYRGMPE